MEALLVLWMACVADGAAPVSTESGSTPAGEAAPADPAAPGAANGDFTAAPLDELSGAQVTPAPAKAAAEPAPARGSGHVTRMGLNVAAGMAGGAAGTVGGALLGGAFPVLLWAAFMSIILAREWSAGGSPPLSRGIGGDAVAFAGLFALVSWPVVMACAGTGDVLGFLVGASVGARGDFWRVLAAAVAGAVVLVPPVLAVMVGAAFLGTWLGASWLPDVLMIPAFGGLGLGAVLLVVGALVVRPALHLALLVVEQRLR